jgi:hypothetical protein
MTTFRVWCLYSYSVHGCSDFNNSTSFRQGKDIGLRDGYIRAGKKDLLPDSSQPKALHLTLYREYVCVCVRRSGRGVDFLPGNINIQPKMEFLDISFTKDLNLLLHAIHSPFKWQILKKTSKQENLSLFMTSNFVE